MSYRSSLVAVAIALGASSGAFAADRLYVDGNTVKEVQRTLRERGFQVGVDGIMGPRTQAVLRQFQKSENLDPTGRLNRQTLVALGLQESPSGGASGLKPYSQEIVRKVQATLNARGFQAGETNGRIGPRTREALKEFQKSENLEETGRLNPGTLAALGIEVPGTSAAAGR